MRCKYMWVMCMIIWSIHLLSFINYDLGYFCHVGNRIVAYSPIEIHSQDLLVFACWWSFKLLSLCILCNKWNLVTFHQGAFLEYIICFISLMASLWSTEICLNIMSMWHKLCGILHLDAHASRPAACLLLSCKVTEGCSESEWVQGTFHTAENVNEDKNRGSFGTTKSSLEGYTFLWTTTGREKW